MRFLQVTLEWYGVISLILGGAGGSSLIILFVLRWWRFKSKDKAGVGEIDAKAYKLKAEAEALKVESDIKISKEIKDWAIQLNDELRKTKEELSISLKNCDDTQEELSRLQIQHSLVKDELNLTKDRIREMEIQNEQLQIQLRRFLDNQRGRPT